MFSLVFGLIFLTASICCFGVSFFFYQKSKAVLARSVKTQGTVADFIKSGGVYYPLFEFQPQSGNPVTIKATVGGNPPRYKIGEKVSVIYHPDSPHEARIDTLFQNYLESLISGAVGGFCFIFGLIFSIFF